MLKKTAMILSMTTLLGLGCMQLWAGGRQPCSSQQESCCPSTYQGGSLVYCYDMGSTVSCVYSGPKYLTGLYCPY